jgi:hypothetical protein
MTEYDHGYDEGYRAGMQKMRDVAREAEQRHRAAVDLVIREALIEAVETFAPCNPSDPELHWATALDHAVDLIMAGRIPHVKVEM